MNNIATLEPRMKELVLIYGYIRLFAFSILTSEPHIGTLSLHVLEKHTLFFNRYDTFQKYSIIKEYNYNGKSLNNIFSSELLSDY